MLALLPSILLTSATAIVFAASAIGFVTSASSPRPRRAIIAHYDPPTGVAMLAAASLLGENRQSLSAQLVDLAVRRVIRILDPEAPGGPYRLQLVRADELSGVELSVVQAVFGRSPTPGTIVAVNARNGLLQRRLGWAQSQADAWVRREGLTIAQKNGWRAALPFAQLLLVPTTIGVSGFSLPFTLAAVLFGAGTVALAFGRYSALSRAGADLRDHLAGLSLYIRLAEADRMRVLQGPGTALRTAEVVQLTERLLGWAVLFGFGRAWAAILERLGADQAAASTIVGDLPVLLALSDSFDGVIALGLGLELPPDDAAVTADGTPDFGSANADWSSGSGGDGGSGSGGDGGGGGGD